MRLTVPRRLAALCLLLGASVVTATAPAVGAPIDDKRKAAAAIEAAIAAATESAADFYEQLKYVEEQLAAANLKIADAEARIAAARAETHRLGKLIDQRAAAVYRSSQTGAGTSMFDIDMRHLSAREKYADAASARDNKLLDELAAAREELRVRQRDAQEAKQLAESEKAKLDAIRVQFEAAQAERQRLLDTVNSEIAALVAEAAAQRAAAEAPKGNGDDDFDPGQLPPASGLGAVALAYAQAQLGKPYCYAGTGPTCYDCSGLTMMAWGAAGVSIPHNSEAQYNSFPHVPMNQLAPGDIVWYPGHVGLYAGNGAVIHASSSNNAVRYQSVSYYQGAARPG